MTTKRWLNLSRDVSLIGIILGLATIMILALPVFLIFLLVSAIVKLT